MRGSLINMFVKVSRSACPAKPLARDGRVLSMVAPGCFALVSQRIADTPRALYYLVISVLFFNHRYRTLVTTGLERI